MRSGFELISYGLEGLAGGIKVIPFGVQSHKRSLRRTSVTLRRMSLRGKSISIWCNCDKTITPGNASGYDFDIQEKQVLLDRKTLCQGLKQVETS